MTTDNKTYYRLSTSPSTLDNPAEVVLEYMDGSKVRPHTQKWLGLCLQEQAEQREYVYIAKTYKPEQQGYKVGRTKNLTRRERELGLQVALVVPCDVWHDFSAIYLESFLHELYNLAGLRITREWFDLNWWDIELVRIFFQDLTSFKEQEYSFLAFYQGVGYLRELLTKNLNADTNKVVRNSLNLWNKQIEVGKRIFIVYLIRHMVVAGRVPPSLFRYAVEHLMYLEQQQWSSNHIRPLEKTFEEAVEECLSLNSTP
jgi:hypothetical protein